MTITTVVLLLDLVLSHLLGITMGNLQFIARSWSSLTMAQLKEPITNMAL